MPTVILFQVFLANIHFPRDLLDPYLTNSTTPSQSEPRSNDNEGVFPVSPKLQNWSLTTRCSLVPCPVHPKFFCFEGDLLNLLQDMQSPYSKLSQQSGKQRRRLSVKIITWKKINGYSIRISSLVWQKNSF